MNNEVLVDTIKQWMTIENEISENSRKLRELRKQKKDLNITLMNVMKQNDIDCFDCKSGQITYNKTNVKKSINKKYLNDILEKYFQNKNQEEAEKICSYILENRDTQVRESIKLKKKKI